jgi:hypothetical protein
MGKNSVAVSYTDAKAEVEGLVERFARNLDVYKQLYQRQIEATDRQIDALVYELYGLTEEEIAVVEETVAK